MSRPALQLEILIWRRAHTPAVSDERIANKDCRAIGNAYTHGGGHAAGNRDDEEEEEEEYADAIASFRVARKAAEIVVGDAN